MLLMIGIPVIIFALHQYMKLPIMVNLNEIS